MRITVNPRKLQALKDAVHGTAMNMRREFATVLNKTAKAGERIIAKEVATELATPIKVIAKTIRQRKRAAPDDLKSSVEMGKTKRIPLREFGARQTRAGTSYKISRSKGRKTIRGAFQGPKPGVMKASWRGNVFRRVGKMRLPIVKLYGPSPWGVAVVGRKVEPSRNQIQAELNKQINRRLDYILKKKSGVI